MGHNLPDKCPRNANEGGQGKFKGGSSDISGQIFLQFTCPLLHIQRLWQGNSSGGISL